MLPLSAAQLGRLHEQIRVMENHRVNGKPIGESATQVLKDADALLHSGDALMPVLRTALVINWKEAAMAKRYQRFKREFPAITSLSQLKQVMQAEDPMVFCRTYLDINASSADNPKYVLLKNLVDGFLDYMADQQLASEIEALRHWAERVDLKQLSADPIGKRRGVGPGVVGNLRISLGLDAIKPDRHVIGVMQQYLELKVALHQYDAVAGSLGLRKRYFDELLFRYGQAMQISA